ncbi:hypothetical protein LSTR_LSTR014971 [Laodelphax striatellus]|uniref:RanBP2-type domain-containing protein n=1 Tax=Laodelphax striatellus TaxID=195883 RepID=A0A482WSK6_LAOST|nr:hypothetical protein LSTR_LSTR014971 [Laodelphax striatellus]
MNNSAPPILVGERVFWLASGSGIPQASTVRWIGHLPEIGPEWTIGVELDNPLPYGGIDGAWGNRLLFTCKPKHGLLVPQSQIAPATHCGSGNIANFIPDIGANSKLKTSCKDLCQSSLNSLDNNKNNQIIKYKPNITTSSTAEVRNYDFGNSHDLPAISSAAFLPEGSQRDEISPRAPPRNRVELKLKYADITGDGNEALFSDYRNEIAWFKVKHNNDGSRIVDVCNLNRRTRTKDVDPNADNVKRMSGVFSQNVQASSQVESISVSDSVQFASRRQVFFRHGRSHSDSSQDVLSSSSRKEKTASGLFSFLRWFRRIKSEGDTDDEDDEDDDDETGNSNNCSNAIEVFPPSPRLIRSNSSSCGSVDTLFSTATASSFAFIHPYNYRPFGPVLQSQTRIADDADTETYRQRVKQSERVRQLDKNISLKKKYNLFGSGTICRSLDSVAGRFAKIENTDSDNNLATGSQGSTLNRKKRKAPPPPQLSPNDYSLPSTLNHLAKQKTTSGKDKLKVNNLEEPFHRRTVSESARDKKAGAYCHVRGKRKAPPPPVTTSAAGNEKVNKSGNHSLGRKKRPAPQPPKQVNSEKQSLTEVSSIEKQSFTVDPSTAEASSTSVENKNNVVRYRNNNSSGREKKQGSLSLEEKERLLKNIAKLQAVAEKRSSLCCTPPSSPNLSQKMAYSLSNDTLRLEKGILKPNRSEDGASPSSTASSSTSNLHVDATKLTPSSPVSPRPWYKRNIIKDNHSSPSGKTLFDKKKEKTKVDDWMPDVAISRSSLIVNDSGNKFNLFSPKSDKVDEKRKSQISMLVNISELDREAAEIVQKEHAKEKAILDAEDAKFYSFPELQDSATNNDQHIQQSVDSPKRSSARELVSLFNAITNVTKVTVNTTFFSRETASLFSRDGREKRFSFGSNATREDEKLSQFDRPSSPRNTEIKQETVIFEARETYLESPGEKRRRWNRVNAVESDDADVGGEAGRVTIEEIKEFDDEEDENAEKNSKTQALFEANRLKRHHSPSPSIPTIAEVSETTSSVATTPGSAIQSLASPTTPTTPHPFPGPSTVDPKPLTKTPVSNSYWACTQCTLENPSWRFTCEVCDTWKPSNIKTKQVILPFNRLNKPTVTNKDENEKEQLNLNDDSLLKNIDDEILLRKKLHDTKEIDIEKDAITVNDTSPEVTNEKPIDLGESTDIEEVRKARLAFFNKSDTIEDQADRTNEDKSLDVLNIIKVSGVKPVIQSSSSSADERLKLREMLKDLKHSLPKRSKQAIPSGDSTEKSQPSSTSKKNVDSSENAISYGQVVNDTAVKNLGAIKKTTTPIQKNDKRKTPAADVVKSVEVDEKKNEKAEVYLMKTETIIEEIRMKKQPDQKPNKVSSSAQTSSIIRKCDIPPNTEKPIVENHLQKTNSNSYVVPITEEEYTIKDGVLSSSISKNKTTIGKKTFELILAQDFADIKATKTGKGFLPAHVYANLPSKASLASKVNDADEPSSSSDALSTPAAVDRETDLCQRNS